MTPEEFQKLYPLIAGWIESTLRAHAGQMRPVASAGFARLPLYYRAGLLARARFIPVGRAPTPPLADWGLAQFADFQRMEPAGITYLENYFVQQDHVASERLHFHELIHVVQWRLLGPERFLALYAEGLERYGCRDSPLEVMAYDAEDAFVRGAPFDAEQLVQAQLARLTGGNFQ